MGSPKILRRAAVPFALLVSVVAAPAALVAACSSNNDQNPVPPVPTYNVPDATTNTSPDSSSGGGGDDSSTGTTDAHEEPAVRDDAASCNVSAPAALGAPDSGCWSCEPVLPSDFLNHCAGTGVTCVPFDNGRLPGFDGGALPPTN
jgi:hypothetical protein